MSRFLLRCRQLNITSSTPLLLAVSGGRDSVALEHLCHHAGFNYHIAHCNFHLRGDDSDRDERFVRDLAQQHGRQIHVAQFDTRQYAADNRLSIEEAARNLRYAFFEQIRQKEKLDYIVVAHHRDDAIETFFINLLRGTGIAGLHGIRDINGHIVRPLLIFSRQEIDDYIRQHNLAYVEDATNASDQYRRNQIRHQLLPLLRQMSPAFDNTMQRTMSHLADVETIYKETIDCLRSQIESHNVNGDINISLSDIHSLEPQSTLLFEMLRPYGFNAAQVTDILASLSNVGSQYLSPTHILIIDRETIIISPSAEGLPDTTKKQLPEFTTQTIPPPADLALIRQWTDDTHAYFDADRVKMPLRIRHWKEGDRFYPFGMKGSQLLSDYFSDHKYSLLDKQRQPLLVDSNGQIMWIVGHRTDRRTAVTATTQKMIEVSITTL